MLEGSTPEFWTWAAISVFLWAVVAIYSASTLFWTYEMVVLRRRWRPPALPYGPEHVQVRILTVGRADVVRRTVEELPAALDDVHVVAETSMVVPGATVHVVPDEFECEATRKGRAVEWARRSVACEREFVLYLDEDTVVTEFPGVPDADVVQFGERPTPTGSKVAFLAEIFRMGFQLEQRAFPLLDVPLYAWGGGLAVRASVQDAVTWDVDSIIEDTTFTWRAVVEYGASFAFVPTAFENQAPPSVRAMVKQRRRWLAGSRQENEILPPDYWLLYGLRNLSWGVSPLVPFLGVAPLLLPRPIVFQTAYLVASGLLLAALFSWTVLGLRYYDAPVSFSVLALALAPVLTIVHSVGALYGIVSPPSDFDVTEKVLLEEAAVILSPPTEEELARWEWVDAEENRL